MPDINNTQIAVLKERIEYIAKSIDEIRPLITAVTMLRHESDSLGQQVRQLTINSESRAKAMHDLDKRVLVLERWHKAMVGFSATAMAVLIALGSYTKSFIDTVQDDRNDTNRRLSNIELIIGQQKPERRLNEKD